MSFKKCVLHAFIFFCSTASMGQELLQRLHDEYQQYREPSLAKRRIKHHEIQPLIESLASDKEFSVSVLGSSVQGRPISLISIGEGPVSILFWSQMHGNEPTATMALFDILNFLRSDYLKKEKQKLLKNTTLHFIPMLNPDGAEVYSRYNALGIDINRDAVRLQTPEGKILKDVRDSLQADFGFNLHDQSKYYNAELTSRPATISYLAPAYNYKKEINEVRANAMKVIVHMNQVIQQYAPGQVGRYSDSFEPRAFGDNIMKWGTSAILIESGGYAQDPEKQYIRKLNFLSILSAVFTIADQSFQATEITEYEQIPNNDRKLFDVKIKGATYWLDGKSYKVDLGINHFEVDNFTHDDFYYHSRIVDIGDLSTYYGYQEIDAQQLTIKDGKVYQSSIDPSSLQPKDFQKLVADGHTYFASNEMQDSLRHSPYPMHLVSDAFQPSFKVSRGANPTFLLTNGDQITYTLINGFVVSQEASVDRVKNSLILK
ncbi:MAG: peptidase M14 [Cyclobacteriaceae bacterium]|nr:peptidase M14 [Cyclobacteriaceae bacterium HetDA_MAG_MS6]